MTRSIATRGRAVRYLLSVLPASCRQNEAMRDGTICRQDAGSTLSGKMQSEKGSATVPVALFGVSPNSWCGRFHSPFGAPSRVLPPRRRDADGSGRDDRAPHPQLHRSGLVLRFVMLAALLRASAAPASDFSREVRPLLEEHCFKCHGLEKQKGGLRFDTKEGAFKTGESGEIAIVPGRANESRLIKLVSSKDDKERMPSKGDALSAAQIDLLKRWIDAGAEWSEVVASTGVVARSEMIVTDEDRKHWSYLPLTSLPVPAVKNAALARTPVDRFILARLEENKLAPSPPADARKLVRRIYFDLIGLPPTPEQVESFVQQFTNHSRLAVVSLVDQLLASPHYGERWARHWLDVVRYADSDGQESDADRPTAHHYRDFVIRSLNDGLAFDTFVRWQLAGDELEPDNPQAIAATGFIVAGTHAVLADNLMEEERIRTRFNELDDMIARTPPSMRPRRSSIRTIDFSGVVVRSELSPRFCATRCWR